MKNLKLWLLGVITAATPVLLFLQGKKLSNSEIKADSTSRIISEMSLQKHIDSLCIALDYQKK